MDRSTGARDGFTGARDGFTEVASVGIRKG